MGIIFEKMCRDYLLLYEQELPIILNRIEKTGGVTQPLLDLAENSEIILLTPEDLYTRGTG